MAKHARIMVSKQARKALIGALVAGVGAATTALADGQLTALDGLTIAGAVLTAWQAVYWTTNDTTVPQLSSAPVDGSVDT